MSQPSSHKIIVYVVVLAALLLGHSLWHYYMASPWTRDGRVRADVVQIAPDVSGFLTEVNIKDDQFVHAGDTMLVIDRARYELALKHAEAVTASHKAQMELALRNAKHYQTMREESTSALDRDQKNYAATIAVADYEQAAADEGTAKLNLERTAVKAPIDGYVSNFDLRVGNYETASHPIFALVAANSFYVNAYMEETKLNKVHVGDKARIHLMGVDPEITGHVESVSYGIVDRERNASPDLLANVNPTFSWVRLAQRIPVRIELDPPPEGVRLVSGQTATVSIEPEKK
ncbi:MAG: HlyD family secretion protein [Alphaproteobacteria bacterium]